MKVDFIKFIIVIFGGFRNIYLRLLRCILKYIENIYMKIELKIYFFCNLLKGKCKDIFFYCFSFV